MVYFIDKVKHYYRQFLFLVVRGYLSVLCASSVALWITVQVLFAYRYIHKQHHKFAAPFGLAAEYAHPIETVILGLGFFIGPLFWCLFQELHVFTMVIWLAVRLIQVVDAHSGYDFPIVS